MDSVCFSPLLIIGCAFYTLYKCGGNRSGRAIVCQDWPSVGTHVLLLFSPLDGERGGRAEREKTGQSVPARAEREPRA